MDEIDLKKIYIETDGKSMKSLLQFAVEFDRYLQKENEKAGKRREVRTKELGQKSYNNKIMCLSCKRETGNKQPVKYFQSSSESGNPKFSIRAMCSECGKGKSKFIKADDVSKDLKRLKSSKI